MLGFQEVDNFVNVLNSKCLLLLLVLYGIFKKTILMKSIIARIMLIALILDL